MKNKKKLEAIVESTKMTKAAIVSVANTKKHKKYNKSYVIHKRILVKDVKEQAQKGDMVIIQESTPFSKKGRWELVEIKKNKEK